MTRSVSQLGNLRIISLLFVDEVVLLASTVDDL